MKGIERTAWFVLGMFMMIACAAVEYPYYGFSQIPDDCWTKGKLLGRLGSGGWPDLDFSNCKPDASKPGKCWVQESSVFFAKETALQECQQALSDCQKGNPPNPSP